MAKRYKKLSAKIPLRNKRMLRFLTQEEKLESPVPLEHPYNLVAPGLYPEEHVLELDTGDLVAVSVDPEWLEGQGLAFTGYARWINEDGSTKLSADGKQTEVTLSNTFDHGWLEKYSQSELATEIIRIMLGEEEKIKDVLVKKDVSTELSENQEWSNPNAKEIELLPLSEEMRRNGDIRAAIKHVKAMENVELNL